MIADLTHRDPSSGASAPDQALEFRVGRTRIAVRIDRVARVIEVPWAPLPLSSQLVLGLGFDDERPIVCISLAKTKALAAPSAITKAVLLEAPMRVGWALCIDEVFKVTPVVRLEANPETTQKLPGWIKRAHTADGRTIGWIDTDLMVAELAMVAR